MKKTYFVAFLIFFSLTGIQAQTVLAYYPLLTDAEDTTGNNNDIYLYNAPFLHNGVYSNGIYDGDDPAGSVISSPNINNFNFDDFSVRLQFFVEEYPEFNKPIIVGGISWRWIAAWLDEEGKISLVINDGETFQSEATVPLNNWNTLILAYNRQTKILRLVLNGNIVVDQIVQQIDHHNDGVFANKHAGYGFTFKGYWRKLSFYDSYLLSGVNECNGIEDIIILQRNDNLLISIPQNEAEVQMHLVDMSGRTVFSRSLTGGTNNINTSFIRNGSYIVALSDKSGHKVTKKIVLSR